MDILTVLSVVLFALSVLAVFLAHTYAALMAINAQRQLQRTCDEFKRSGQWTW